MVLNKRIFRELKANFARYLALFMLITGGMFACIALSSSADSVVTSVKDFMEHSNVEDGCFSVFVPLSDSEIDELCSSGAEIEKQFNMDMLSDDGSKLRIFQSRKAIDIEHIDSGTAPEQENEIMLESSYAKAHDLHIGDSITLSGKTMKITALGVAPDYDFLLENYTDTAANAEKFSIAFVSGKGYSLLRDVNKDSSEEFLYAYTLPENMTHAQLKKLLDGSELNIAETDDKYISELIDRLFGTNGQFSDTDFNNISFFMQRESNPRIGASLAKVGMYHVGGIITGAVILILFAYICSIFVIGTIEQESQFIGALYAMGVHRKKIMLHYITLPVVITLIGGIIGTVSGCSPLGRGLLTSSVIGPYSVPQVKDHYSVWLLVYGILMPPVLAAAVNFICLRRKLNTEPLRLLRKEQKESRLLNIDLHGMGYFNRFRIRQILRELRITAAMFGAIVMGVLLLMIAIVTYVCIDDLAGKYENEIPYRYCYYMKYPDVGNIPENAEACYSKSLNYTYMDFTLQVTVMGVEENSKRFPFEVSHDKNAVSVAEGTAVKYGLRKGDMFCLHDDVVGTDHNFKVDSIVPYSAGLNVFMNIDTARELFEVSDSCYNMLLSDEELDIDSGRVLSVTTRESMTSAVETLLSDMMPMIIMTGVSALAVYISVLYIMMKMMIDRSAFQISLIRIFGYHSNEIKRLYLDGNTLTVVISAIIALPAAKLIIDLIWPIMVYNQPAGYACEPRLWHYAAIFAVTMLCYYITNSILMRKIRRITPAEVLKDRQ
ncbi:MAG: ABC transporter permease [Ruminococcus sp.]|nr:ABC transporter permease [Ruminococcus sp.]